MEKKKENLWSSRVEELINEGYDLLHKKIFPRKIPDELWKELFHAIKEEGYRKTVLVPRGKDGSFVLLAKK